MKATDLRQGLGVKIDGKICVLSTVEHRTPGNLRAFIQIKYKDVQTGKSFEKRLGSSDDVDVIDLDRCPMQYAYSTGAGAIFQDTENWEEHTLAKDILGDSLQFLRENTAVIVLMHDGNPVLIEMPGTVELMVKDCPPEVKGATVTNQLKDAEMETGLKVRVPSFIKVGETLRISTADGSYQSRA